MEIKRMVVGELGTNCYIVENNGLVSVIDPGADCDAVLREIEGLKLDKIILTHGHFDHFMAASELKEKTNAPVYISSGDSGLLTDWQRSLYWLLNRGEAGFKPVKADFFIEDTIDISGEEFTVIKTPGHSEGSICLLKDDILFSGDTLFARSIGRYDFGSYDEIMTSLWNLMFLDDNVNVFPGHGEATTIGIERKENPYIR